MISSWWARGYTVIEVLIVLAISTVVFISGMAMFRGQSTAFEQSMEDINSEIATRIRGAGASQFFNSEGYICTVSGNPPRAILTAGSQSGSGNKDCIVVGRAVEAHTGSNYLYFYEVLGNRLAYGSGNNAIGPASSLAEANPTPAIAGDADLIFAYKIASDVKVVSSVVKLSDGSNIGTNLVGFYLDFGGEVSASQNTALAGKAYNYQSATHDTSAIKNCIEATSCQSPTSFQSWSICFASDSGNRRAQIDITPQASGATTNLKFVNCT